MLRTAVRSLTAHRLRFLLPALAVVLGVACTSGSLLYTDSVRAALTQAQHGTRADVAVAVQPDPGAAEDSGDGAPPPLDDRLRERVGSVAGAAAVRGTAEGTSFVVGSGGELVGARESAVGANYAPLRDGRDPRHPLADGRGPRSAGEVAFDEHTAARTGQRVGDRVRIVVGGQARTARLVGIVTAHDPHLVSGGTLTLFDTASAQRHFAPGPGMYTDLTVSTRDSLAASGSGAAPDPAAQERLARGVQSVLPDGLRAVTRQSLDAESSAGAQGDQDKLTGILLSFGAVALLVATFLIANTFTMLSAARAREHALLRVVGATRGYVLRLVLTEALLVGAVAAAVGHLLGFGVAGLLGHFFGATDGPGVPLRFTAPLPAAAAFAVGIVTTLVAAYVPARRAAAVAPVAALRTDEPPEPASLRRRNLVGAAVTALGALLTETASGSDDPGVVTVAGAVLLLGLVLLTPVITLGMTRLIRRPLTRLAGVHGTLAVLNARRNPRRTAATAATLMIGLALVSAATVGAASLGRAAEREAGQAMASDLQVKPVDYAEIGEGTAERIARLPDTEAVTPAVSALVSLRGGGHLQAVGVDPRTVQRTTGLTVLEGSLDRLDRGIAVTRQELAAHGWRLGTRVEGAVDGTGSAGAGGKDAKFALPVVAVYDGPEAVGPALVPDGALPRVAAGPDGLGPRIDSLLVAAAPGRTAALTDDIRRTLDNPALLVQDRAEAGREAARPFEPLLDIVYALLSVAVLIGSLGVVNTMAMAVFERVREIGLLRAIGLERGRVAAILRLESMLISVLGAALGVVSGTVLGIAAVAGQEGAPVELPWERLLLFCAAAAAIGVLAAVLPGRTAARVPVLRAVGPDVG
ncbi:Macrolide export ATP-binding/permease protein MacB [Streptomyces sp. YIM 130001]|uniref:FtsX-like permease family protein n=1 Tax=Streptomyces sp. YIM 130001 TaxID=2259644 RepID=UPI000E6503F6|nr:ABC transporter permease [Streptomyces sp. YIM 130001]RII15947.1 Macrolide export ATP-binding/permease protein MacB [Streptomyces sp. YIM 130001]